MTNFAVVDNTTSVVENIIVAEPGFTLPGKTLVEATSETRIGGTYNDEEFFPPEEPPLPVPPVISRRQFYQGLAIEEYISEEDALAAMAGVIPPALVAIVNQLPPEHQFNAKMLLIGATEFYRDNPLVDVFAADQELTPEEVDQFWRDCFAL